MNLERYYYHEVKKRVRPLSMADVGETIIVGDSGKLARRPVYQKSDHIMANMAV